MAVSSQRPAVSVLNFQFRISLVFDAWNLEFSLPTGYFFSKSGLIGKAYIIMGEKIIISEGVILDRIYIIRGYKVMIDADLAFLYGVNTRDLNKAVHRNLKRFPDDFMFQLTNEEFKNLMFQFGTSRWGGRRKSLNTLKSLIKQDNRRWILTNEDELALFMKNKFLSATSSWVWVEILSAGENRCFRPTPKSTTSDQNWI